MDKKYALIFAFLITGLIASEFILFDISSADDKSNRESVVISRVIDGDTVELDDGRILRLANINSPEKGAIGYELSAEFMKSFENKTVDIEVISTDKYSRYLARIYAPEYINLKIVELGFASKFLVQTSELSEFSNAEEDAVANNKGIWRKSDFFGCIISEIDKDEEMVGLTNTCRGISTKGWFLKDESRKTYKFAIDILGSVNLHSGVGANNETDLFWQSSTNIWNSDRDTLYLFDSEGGIVYHESYGY